MAEQEKNVKKRSTVGLAALGEEKREEYIEKVVHINRCSKVVKGGRRFSFSALVVVGDGHGKVGYALGKANEVASAIRKASEGARKKMYSVSLRGTTIPHEGMVKSDGAKVLLRPASKGTGVIAGGSTRAVLEAVGVHDVLAKSLGSSNPINVVKATIDCLRSLRSLKQLRELRRG